jgi:transcriptional regulator with XRE-family HTH domain
MIVKKLRDRKGWTQDQLAECCGLNVRTIQRVESGKKAYCCFGRVSYAVCWFCVLDLFTRSFSGSNYVSRSIYYRLDC